MGRVGSRGKVVFAAGIELMDKINSSGNLVVPRHTFGAKGACQRTYFVGLKEFVLFVFGIFHPNFELTVIFKRTDIHKTGGPGKSFFVKLFHQSVFLAVHEIPDLWYGTLVINKM